MHLTNRHSRHLAATLLLIILVVAAGLRFYNINWDNGIFAHPDERSTVAFYAPTITWPEDSSTLLDPRTSTLNPFWDVRNQSRRSYTYGHFPLYTLVFVANVFNDLASVAAAIDLPPEMIQFLANSLSGHGFARIGRGLMALADLFSVYLLFLIGRRLYGLWGGVLAAALSAFTVLQIQLAHFFAVDPVSTTFTLLAIYGAILLFERQSTKAAIITGLGIALAVSSKFSALPIVFAPMVAGYLAVIHHNAKSRPAGSTGAALQNRMLGLVLLSLGLAFGVFAITSPYVLLDFDNFRQAVLEEQGNMVSGVADFPFTRQYRNTPAYWYFVEQQLRWGMGWPLGLLALAGTLWVIGKAVQGKAQPGEWIALSWIVLYFVPTGLFLAKFMRYMVPVVPLFTLFGAGLVVALWRYQAGERQLAKESPSKQMWARSEMADCETRAGDPASHPRDPESTLLQKLPKGLAIALAVVALSGAIIWSLAFVTGVYGTEHTWVTFARWTYAHVPDGSCIAYEHWDDRMPTDIPEPGGNPAAHEYFQPQLPMYDDDSQQKYDFLRETLMNCDYVVLASNRLWRTIPGLPERYPMSSRYYEALFSGELGFEQLYAEETPPHLGQWVIDDQPADESFTVYDHPKPILFKKTRQLSRDEWDTILGNTWQTAIAGYIGEPTLLMRLRGASKPPAVGQNGEEPAQKSLLLDTPIDQFPVVDDFRWNDLANSSTIIAVLFWWAVVMLVGLAAFPLTFLVCHKLPDRGYALSKSLGILLISYFVWLNSSLGWLGNTMFTAILAVIVIMSLSIWIARRHRRALLQFFSAQHLPVLMAEIIFSAVYLFFVYLRILNPDLWQPWLGGEKMLEIGFLNAVVKSAEMPPYDPFFAGGIINYYYYGLFIIGVLIKLTGIEPSIAFNLAIPILAALTATNVFSLAGNLAVAKLPYGHLWSQSSPRAETAAGPVSPPWGRISVLSGLLGVLFVVFIGNLEGAAQLMRDLGRLNATSNFTSAIPGLETLVLALGGLVHLSTNDAIIATYNYWDPTRVIPQTINEFPYFSFLFADLHPHMIGIPFTVLFLSLAYNWLRSTDGAQPIQGHKPLNNEDQRTSAHSIPNSHSSQFTLRVWGPLLLRWLTLPFVLGAIAVINTWDLPTYLGLMVATFLLGHYRRLGGPVTIIRALRLIVAGAAFAGVLLAATYILYLPFFANYQPPAETGLGLVHTKTPLNQHLKIWGLFIFIIVSWLWLSLRNPASRNGLLRITSLFLRRWNVWPHLSQIYLKVVKPTSDSYQMVIWGIGLAILTTILLLLLGYTVPAYLFPLVVIALPLVFRREVSTEVAYLGLLAFTGLSILLGVEFFFLRDFLGGGDHYRMNTLFKFFIQVWVLFGLMTAVALPQLWRWGQRWPLSSQLIWQGTALLLLLATLVYPFFATRVRVNDRFPGDDNRPAIGTLDGLAYMSVGVFEWPAGSPVDLNYDYEAIHWLQDNVRGTPIIAEAKIGYYREGGMRVAAYTGLPSVLGGLHQNEQRYAWQISARDVVVNEFWTTPDPTRTLEIIDQLNISYIYLGQVERITYGDQIEAKFEELRRQGALELVFKNEKTKIYSRSL